MIAQLCFVVGTADAWIDDERSDFVVKIRAEHIREVTMSQRAVAHPNGWIGEYVQLGEVTGAVDGENSHRPRVVIARPAEVVAVLRALD